MDPIPFPEPPLAGSTFRLRPFRPEDFDAAVEIGSGRGAELVVPSLPAADAAGVMQCFDDWRNAGEMLHLVIADRTTDAYLGEVSLAIGDQGVGEVGCGVAEQARGRGVATEALTLLASWSFAELRLGRLQMFVLPANAAARRLAERTGFRSEGTLRAYWEHDGARLDTLILSLLPDDLA